METAPEREQRLSKPALMGRWGRERRRGWESPELRAPRTGAWWPQPPSFPVSLPRWVLRGRREGKRRSSRLRAAEAIAPVVAHDETLASQRGEAFANGAGAHAAQFADPLG